MGRAGGSPDYLGSYLCNLRGAGAMGKSTFPNGNLRAMSGHPVNKLGPQSRQNGPR